MTGNTSQNPEISSFYITIFVIFALLLFYMRPSGRNNSNLEPTKARPIENNVSKINDFIYKVKKEPNKQNFSKNKM